ncbi:MAG: FlgO family outer membrane protein [Colwellia sp.]
MLSNKKTFFLSAILILGVSGCCSTSENFASNNAPVNAPNTNYQHSSERIIHGREYAQSNNPNWGWQPPANSYRPMYTGKLLSDYTEQLAMKLIENMKYVTDRTPIAVTSFVNLDNNLQTTNIFGNQLAESFISELQEFGLSVVDFKHTGSVRVTRNGDFSFSRNGDELGSYPSIEYVLSGTLTYNDRGVIVNARLIGTESKVVVATAKGFIPHFVVDSLHSRGRRDGITLSAVN